jgi:hypothetical protein
MAERYAVATGNWSNTATWDGGTLPGAGDDVHANNYEVTIDQDITVASLRTTAGTTAVAGGTFAVSSGNRTINADTYMGSGLATYCLQSVSSGRFTQNGDSYGSASQNSSAGTFLRNESVQNGNAYAGTGGNFRHGTQAQYSVFNGNSYGSSGNNSSYGLRADIGCVQNGDSFGGASGAGTSMNGAVQNGNATGGSGSQAIGTVFSTGLNIFYGDVTGGSVSGAVGLSANEGIALIGTATGTVANAFGVQTSGSNRAVVLIETESGSYPKSLNADTETTDTNVPFINYGGGGGGGSSRPMLPFLQGVIG